MFNFLQVARVGGGAVKVAQRCAAVNQGHGAVLGPAAATQVSCFHNGQPTLARKLKKTYVSFPPLPTLLPSLSLAAWLVGSQAGYYTGAVPRGVDGHLPVTPAAPATRC
jgi:hypothetical protein